MTFSKRKTHLEKLGDIKISKNITYFIDNNKLDQGQVVVVVVMNEM